MRPSVKSAETVRLAAQALFVIILLSVSPVSAYWSEVMDVAVVDTIGRPVSNANITVVYQSTGCNVHSLVSKLSGPDGRAHFEFFNTVEETAVTTDCVERSYPITVTYASTANSTTGNINYSNLYVLALPVVYYTLQIVDVKENALTDAGAVYRGATYRADMRGIITLPIPINTAQDATVVFGNITRSLRLQASSDETQNVKLPVYDLRIRVFDEYGQRLPAIVRVDGMAAQATESADAIFEKFSYETARINVTVGERSIALDQQITNDTVEVHFDMSAPVIRELRAEIVERYNVKVTAAIADGGNFASGITENPSILYWLDAGQANVTEIKMFLEREGMYSAVLPAHNADIGFRIVANDSQGNSASYDGNYTFTQEKKSEQVVTQLSPTMLVGLAVFAVVLIFVYQ